MGGYVVNNGVSVSNWLINFCSIFRYCELSGEVVLLWSSEFKNVIV